MAELSLLLGEGPNDLGASKPLLCKGFVAGRRVEATAGIVTVDKEFANSLLDPRDPLDICEEARLEGGELVRLVDDDLIGSLGLQNGDSDFEACNVSDQCFPLEGSASYMAAYTALADESQFELRFIRPGTGPIKLDVRLSDCPGEGAEADCT